MSLELQCDACGQDLLAPGGILLGPPDGGGRVSKRHLCIVCYVDVDRFVVAAMAEGEA